MSYVWFDTTDYQCYPELQQAVQLMSLITQAVASTVEAHTVIEDDEVTCTLTNTERDTLITDILLVWGAIALIVPFNRAVYPLPNFEGVFIEV